MQRIVAETVQLMQFALVHTLTPVDIEYALGDRGHLVNLISIESDDAQAHEVSDIVDALILRTFPF